MSKAVISRTGSGITLAFCPKSRQRPYVKGEIQLAPDLTITAVRWEFVTSGATSSYGGLALFGPRRGVTERTHLLPTAAITWTRIPGSDLFETTEYAYGQWTVGEFAESIRAIPP